MIHPKAELHLFPLVSPCMLSCAPQKPVFIPCSISVVCAASSRVCDPNEITAMQLHAGVWLPCFHMMLHMLVFMHFREAAAQTDFPEGVLELSLWCCSRPVDPSESVCMCLEEPYVSPVLENPSFVGFTLMHLCPFVLFLVSPLFLNLLP